MRHYALGFLSHTGAVITISTNVSLPYLQSQQAQKHVTVNEALRWPDALVQLSVLYRTTSIAPAVGARYILPAGATGAPWTGQPAGTLMAFQDGAWEAVTPVEGWCTFVADEAAQVVWTGAA